MSSVLVWRLAWCSNGYRGWDDLSYREWLFYGRCSGFGYVKRYGFGHEWWDFYEGFSKEYYYGYAPPIHAKKPVRFRDGGIILFISTPPQTRKWYLVGVYGQASILDEPEMETTLWELVPSKCRSVIREETALKLKGADCEPLPVPTYFVIKARKEYSTPMPQPMLIDVKRDLKVGRLGQAMFKYIDMETALNLLEKAVDFIKKLGNVQGLWISSETALERLAQLISYIYEGGFAPAAREARREMDAFMVRRKAEIPEHSLEDALCENLQVIEDGLRLIGRQMPVPGIGRADIVALDQQNNLVVIEVKSGTADDSTLTQLLSYMHGLKCKENREIRGIIVAEEFTRKLKQAATSLPHIKLVKITPKITIEKAENI